MRATIFDVHFWSATGRILVIHIPNFGISAHEPILTELHVTGERDSVDLRDSTWMMALALADAGNPPGGLVEHDQAGNVRVERAQSEPQSVAQAPDGEGVARPAINSQRGAQSHPQHIDCADGCGLAVTHDGACLDKPGGRIMCDEQNHVGRS